MKKLLKVILTIILLFGLSMPQLDAQTRGTQQKSAMTAQQKQRQKDKAKREKERQKQRELQYKKELQEQIQAQKERSGTADRRRHPGAVPCGCPRGHHAHEESGYIRQEQ